MTDNMTPQLTLDPTAAAAEAVPTLTLTPEAPEAPQVEEEKKIEPVEMDDKLLTDAEKKAVEDFSHKIDIRDTNMILQYGAAAQKNVASFSENALNSVRQGPGRGGQVPLRTGGRAEGLWRGRGEKGPVRFVQKDRQ